MGGMRTLLFAAMAAVSIPAQSNLVDPNFANWQIAPTIGVTVTQLGYGVLLTNNLPSIGPVILTSPSFTYAPSCGDPHQRLHYRVRSRGALSGNQYEILPFLLNSMRLQRVPQSAADQRYILKNSISSNGCWRNAPAASLFMELYLNVEPMGYLLVHSPHVQEACGGGQGARGEFLVEA